MRITESEAARVFWGWTFAGIAVVSIISVICISLAVVAIDKHKADIKKYEYKSKAVEYCLQNGGVWLNDNCLPVGGK